MKDAIFMAPRPNLGDDSIFFSATVHLVEAYSPSLHPQTHSDTIKHGQVDGDTIEHSQTHESNHHKV